MKGKCKEAWKPIVGYEGYYEISNKGNVRSIDRFIVNSIGEGERMMKGKTHCKDIRNYKPLCVKCHRAYDLKDREFSDKHRENISKAKKGVSFGVGRKLSEEHKKAISEGIKRAKLKKKL